MSTAKEEGAVAAIHRYPVKSMMGEPLNATKISTHGLMHDRVYALGDRTTGKIASAKNPSKWPSLFAFRAALAQPDGESSAVRITLPDGRVVSSMDAAVDLLLSEVLGRPVTLLRSAPAGAQLEEYWPNMQELPKQNVVTDEAMPPGTFFDCAAVHVLTTATLDALRVLAPSSRFEPRRFRPNLVVGTPSGASGFVENDWVGHTLSIGNEVQLKVTGPCPRCVMTTLAQDDLPADPQVLRTAAKHNQAHIGIYASVIRGGVIRRGDAVRLQ